MSLHADAVRDNYLSSFAASEDVVGRLLGKPRDLTKMIGTGKTTKFALDENTNTVVDTAEVNTVVCNPRVSS